MHTEFDGFLCARPGEWVYCDAIHSEPPAILNSYHLKYMHQFVYIFCKQVKYYNVKTRL